MNWMNNILDRLADAGPIAYGSGQSPCSEPTALAAIALLAHGRVEQAAPALDWLMETQLPTGAVPVRRDPPTPHWTTSLASLAWSHAAAHSAIYENHYQRPLDQAAAWMLEAEGETSPRQPQFGHDSTLVGWPWVQGTHTWLEPTVFHVLALTARGWSTHARVVAGRNVIFDRLLPTGGANYGNTVVLGQQLLPHVQPSGMCLLALANRNPEGRIRSTLEYLKRKTGPDLTPASLCWAIMGLAAFHECPADALDWLEGAAERKMLSAHHAALLALAAQTDQNPLIAQPVEAVA